MISEHRGLASHVTQESFSVKLTSGTAARTSSARSSCLSSWSAASASGMRSAVRRCRRRCPRRRWSCRWSAWRSCPVTPVRWSPRCLQSGQRRERGKEVKRELKVLNLIATSNCLKLFKVCCKVA